MQDIIHIQEQVDLSFEDPDVPFMKKRINFQKFYDLYSVVTELEAFRFSSYFGKLKGDRNSNGHLVSHLRNTVKTDDSAIGFGSIYANGSNPSGNEHMNSQDATKSYKKIILGLAQFEQV